MKKTSRQFKQCQKKLLLLTVILSFSACGVVPIIENSESDDIFFEEQVKVETQAATKTDAETDDEPLEQVIEETKPQIKFSHSRGYWLAAIEYLQVGEEDEAEWALEQALLLNPNSKISKTLLHQIESDAINVLGEDYFEHKIQYGDSLSKLAKVYLDDPLKFYILAKYNQISNPSRLIIGQNINIPGVKPISVDITKEFPIIVESNESVYIEEEAPLSTEDQAKALIENQKYSAVIEMLGEKNEVISDVLKSILVRAYYGKAQRYLDDNNTSQAKLVLLKAAELEPDNIQINMALIDLDESNEAQQLIDQSMKALAANSPIEAYELINRALKMQPDFIAAIETHKVIKQSLSMYYYKHALMAQRRQELDKAVKYWDEVLILDEGNQNAKLYRAKSIALQSKMKKFVSTL